MSAAPSASLAPSLKLLTTRGWLADGVMSDESESLCLNEKKAKTEIKIRAGISFFMRIRLIHINLGNQRYN